MSSFRYPVGTRYKCLPPIKKNSKNHNTGHFIALSNKNNTTRKTGHHGLKIADTRVLQKARNLQTTSAQTLALIRNMRHKDLVCRYGQSLPAKLLNTNQIVVPLLDDLSAQKELGMTAHGHINEMVQPHLTLRVKKVKAGVILQMAVIVRVKDPPVVLASDAKDKEDLLNYRVSKH